RAQAALADHLKRPSASPEVLFQSTSLSPLNPGRSRSVERPAFIPFNRGGIVANSAGTTQEQKRIEQIPVRRNRKCRRTALRFRLNFDGCGRLFLDDFLHA